MLTSRQLHRCIRDATWTTFCTWNWAFQSHTHTNTSESAGITGAAKLVILTKGITDWASTFLINQLMRDGISLPKRRLSNASGSTTLSHWVNVLHPTWHKIGHFGDVPQANLLAWYGKLNLTQQKHAFTNQKKCTTTQNKHKTSSSAIAERLRDACSTSWRTK